MDEFNYNSTYSSGWRRIVREQADRQDRESSSILDSNKSDTLKQPIINSSNDKKTDGIAFSKQSDNITKEETSYRRILEDSSKIKLEFEKYQSEIVGKLTQIQIDILSVKQLLDDLKESNLLQQKNNQKKTFGSKLSNFFK